MIVYNSGLLVCLVMLVSSLNAYILSFMVLSGLYRVTGLVYGEGSEM